MPVECGGVCQASLRGSKVPGVRGSFEVRREQYLTRTCHAEIRNILTGSMV